MFYYQQRWTILLFNSRYQINVVPNQWCIHDSHTIELLGWGGSNSLGWDGIRWYQFLTKILKTYILIYFHLYLLQYLLQIDNSIVQDVDKILEKNDCWNCPFPPYPHKNGCCWPAVLENYLRRWRSNEMTTSSTTRLYVESTDYSSTMPYEAVPLNNLGTNGYRKLRNNGKTRSNTEEEAGYGSTNDDTPLMPVVVDDGFDDEEGYSEGYQSDVGAKDRKKRKRRRDKEGCCKRCFKFWCCCGFLSSCRRWEIHLRSQKYQHKCDGIAWFCLDPFLFTDLLFWLLAVHWVHLRVPQNIIGGIYEAEINIVHNYLNLINKPFYWNELKFKLIWKLILDLALFFFNIASMVDVLLAKPLSRT